MISLEENWENIKSGVILPLWNSKYKSMYESVKLDYDDFESLAGIELAKAVKSFDSEKSNLFTYATRVLEQKAKTELRNCTRRDKRKVLYISESLYSLDANGNMLFDVIESELVDSKSSKDDLSDKMVAYLKRLSMMQKQVLFAISEGYSNDEIKRILNISTKELSDAYTAIKSYRNVSLLY